MRPQEFYLLWETRRPRQPHERYAGTLTEADCERLYRAMTEV